MADDAHPYGPAIDVERLKTTTDSDAVFARELITLYRESVADALRDMKRGVDTQDNELIARSAHTIKGSSRNLGADAIAMVAAECERAVRSGERLDPAKVDKLHETFTTTMRSLTSWVASLN